MKGKQKKPGKTWQERKEELLCFLLAIIVIPQVAWEFRPRNKK